jgi:hypothetical protein
MATGIAQTRSNTNDSIIGRPCPLHENVLPTNGDILSNFIHLKENYPYNTKNEIIVNDISKKVLLIWNRSSIPIISIINIQKRILSLKENHRMIQRNLGRINNESFKKKLDDFKVHLNILFDIASCKCLNFEFCTCPREKKVPFLERNFLTDQRNDRKMFIGAIDIDKTRKLNRRHNENLAQTQRPSVAQNIESHRSRESLIYKSTSEIEQPSTSSAQNRIMFSNVARIADRMNVSDRAAAAIATATLADVGLVDKQHSTLVLDRSHLRRNRTKVRTNLQSQQEELLEALYFDGRKDQTLVQQYKNNKYYNSVISEDHYVLLKEPESIYIGHISPSSGTAESISNEILECLQRSKISTDYLRCIGSDGTVVNTGYRGGVIRLLEIKMGRPFHWFICLFHLNELLLRHLILEIDGGTTSPTSYAGTIGKAIEKCENLPICRFKCIKNDNFPIVSNFEDLSTDQKLLYKFCISIMEGNCSESLAQRKPGPISHARWLTTALRILRLYIGTPVPSTILQDLTAFIIKVYGPLWFQIKMSPSCIDGPKHLFSMIKLSRYLPPSQRTIIDTVIQRNGFYGHFENVILAMLVDESQDIRELALRRVVAVKKESEHASDTIRIFKIPIINFEATNYTELLNWHNCDRSVPPLLADTDDNDLWSVISTKNVPKFNFICFPNHSQNVERHIKLVTEASKAVVGNVRRDGYIRATLESRKLMPKFDTKRQFSL